MQISASLAGIWKIPPSFYLPTMMKIVKCPVSKLPNFLKVYWQFFLLNCDLYGCGLSTLYSSATAVGVCLPRISDIVHVYVLAIWNMMTYSGCENCFLYTICKDLLVPMNCPFMIDIITFYIFKIWFTYIWLWKLWSVMHLPTFNVNCDYHKLNSFFQKRFKVLKLCSFLK